MINNAFKPCGLDVCSTILHVEEFSIPIDSCNLKGMQIRYGFDA